VIDPTANRRESGTLRGRVSMRADGYWTPVAADPTDKLEFPLCDMIFRHPRHGPMSSSGSS
jgi:hypothetical protein